MVYRTQFMIMVLRLLLHLVREHPHRSDAALCDECVELTDALKAYENNMVKK